jgi:hypothetical protein
MQQTMRGTDLETGKLFSYASPESLVSQDPPLRAIRALVNGALDRLSPTFRRMYAEEGHREALVQGDSGSALVIAVRLGHAVQVQRRSPSPYSEIALPCPQLASL